MSTIYLGGVFAKHASSQPAMHSNPLLIRATPAGREVRVPRKIKLAATSVSPD